MHASIMNRLKEQWNERLFRNLLSGNLCLWIAFCMLANISSAMFWIFSEYFQWTSDVENIHDILILIFTNTRAEGICEQHEWGATTKDIFYQIKSLPSCWTMWFCANITKLSTRPVAIWDGEEEKGIFRWFVGNPVEPSREIRLSWTGNKSSTKSKVPLASQFSHIITRALQFLPFFGVIFKFFPDSNFPNRSCFSSSFIFLFYIFVVLVQSSGEQLLSPLLSLFTSVTLTSRLSNTHIVSRRTWTRIYFPRNCSRLNCFSSFSTFNLF